MSLELSGKVVMIAGTTGIAAASARLFAQAGAAVFAVGRTPGNAAELAGELRGRGADVGLHVEDLTAKGAAERALGAAVARFGRVDALFHVAGISGRKFGDGPLDACTDAGWDAVMDVNLRAMMQLNRALVRSWLASGQRGAILNMASVLGFSYAAELFDTVAYATAKGAIISLSQHAAATYAARGIRINVIAPALVDTPMASRAVVNPAVRDFLRRKQPLTGAPLTGEDCARAALFLLSDAAAGITGIVLPVDAGWCVSG